LAKDIINIKGDNNLEKLNPFKKDIGVYIFLDEDNFPVYIGVAAEKESKHSLRDRLQKQFNCNLSNSTISKNISTIEKIYGNSIDDETLEKKKLLLLKYAPKLLVIPIGELNEPENISKALELEKLLISLYNSKYNL